MSYHVVRLGNTAPVQVTRQRDGSLRRVKLDVSREPSRETVSEAVVPAGMPLADVRAALTDPDQGGWQMHSDAHAPSWVTSSDPELARALADDFRCELREHDHSRVSVFGDPLVASPEVHREQLAGHVERLA